MKFAFDRGPLFLGVSGKIASGKTTLAWELSSKLGISMGSFGDYIRYVAAQSGLDVSDRKILQDMGLQLLKEDSVGFCRKVLDHCQFKNGHSFILDGIRHPNIAKIVKELAVPSHFYLIYIGTPDPLRASRITVSANSMNEMTSHPVEQEIDALAGKADLLLNGSDSLEQLCSQVLNWLQTL